MPTIPELVYAALLYHGESTENETFVQGTKAADSDKLVFSFQRPDEADGLTLEVFAFVKADVVAENGTTTFFRAGALLSGSKDKLPIEGDEINVGDIALEVNNLPGSTGTVSLQIKVPEGCMLTIDDARFTSTPDGNASDTYTVTASGISADTYSVTFTVKKDGAIVHMLTEYINVLPGMHTDTWSGLAKDEAKEITQGMASTTVYVRGENATWYTSNAPSATASDENSGSYLAPLATIQKAVDTIIARNDGSSPYTICVDGTLDGTTAAYLGTNGMADFSALAQDLNLTIKALSGTATLDGGARFDADGNVEAAGIRKRIIYASTPSIVLNLTLEKLVVTGGFYTGYGGGIIFDSPSGELKISNDTAICGNKGINAGGVMVSSGTFYMSGGKINNCTTELSYQGGGVYINSGGKFIMKGGAISSNKAGLGGGVMVYRGTLEMRGGTIGGENAEDGNTANSGGGVYVNQGTFTMEGGTIIGNEATGKGSGVYQYGMFNMSGTAKVAEDNDVYLSASGSNVATIAVAGELSDSTLAPVATITPSAYTENRPLLTAGENVTLSGSICNKFAVTPQSDGTEWRCALDGANGVLIRKYAMGETGPGGGVVCYYNADGFAENVKTCHYLEYSKEPLGSMTWCPCTSDSGYCEVTASNDIGAGYVNTQAILDHPNHASATASNCAAKACVEYKTDTTAAGEWFLPSRYEAQEIRHSDAGFFWMSNNNRGVNMFANLFFVTSSEVSFASDSKNIPHAVRAVHAF